MPKPRIEGMCRLCGTYGPLSDEHVPPKRAFNDRKFYFGRAANGLPFGPDEMADWRTMQGGVKFPTLCQACNNSTGGWYGTAFVDWSRRGMAILERSGGRPALVYAVRVYPLRVIKQVATMFFSVVHDRFQQYVPDMVRFLLNKEERGVPDGFRFFAYYNTMDGRNRIRYAEPIVTMDVEKGVTSFFAEITFPPFGYVMVLDGTAPPDARPVDITHFGRYSYHCATDIELPLPVLPTHLRMPGDYRSVG